MIVAAATDALYLLAVLACPLGMLLMMWFMGRGMMGKRASGGKTASLPDLKAEHARLAAKIEALETARAERLEGGRREAEARAE